MSKTSLDAQKMLECMLAAVVIIRGLERNKSMMTYKELAIEVGLIGRHQAWHPWDANNVQRILDKIAALDKECGLNPRLNLNRVVRAASAPAAPVLVANAG
jgi:hypothetical protein